MGILHSGRFAISSYMIDLIASASFMYMYFTFESVLSLSSDKEGIELLSYFSYHYENKADSYRISLGISMLALWIKVIMSFRATTILGPFLKVIVRMFYDIIIFIILFSLIVLCFMCIGNLLFLESDSFKNMY